MRVFSRRRVPILPLLLAACALLGCHAPGPHFETANTKGLSLSANKERVLAALGRPHHMLKLLNHPKHCVERWSYTDNSIGMFAPDVETFVVDFDAAGNACDIGHAKAVVTLGGLKVQPISD